MIILLRGTHVAPRVVRFHDAIAKTILSEDRKQGSPYQNIIRRVFDDRNLILRKMRAMSGKTWDDFRAELKPEDEVLHDESRTVVRTQSSKTIKLADYVEGEVSMLSANGIDLADVEMEVAMDSYYEFNNEGVMVEEILPLEEEVVDAAKACALSIQAAGNVGPSPELMWEVQEGKLVRTLIE